MIQPAAVDAGPRSAAGLLLAGSPFIARRRQLSACTTTPDCLGPDDRIHTPPPTHNTHIIDKDRMISDD